MATSENTTGIVETLPTDPRFINLSNLRFHRLLVVGFAGRIKKFNQWVCRCDCGGIATARTSDLRSGLVKSCGCLYRETRGLKYRLLHGEAVKGHETTEYRSYLNARNRCSNKNNPAYGDYGGRGIQFLFTSYEHFLRTMGRNPDPSFSLDRIDNDGNYEPSNCKWASQKEQTRHTRASRLMTLHGQAKCLSEWAEIYQIPSGLVHQRVSRLKWCAACALTQPKRGTCIHR